MNIDDYSALHEKSEPSQRLKPSQLVFHFCVFAVALLANCAGCILVSDLMIPLYLDSIFVVAPFNYDIVNEITKEKIEGKFAASLFTK